MSEPGEAARAYQEIIAGLTAVADELREQDRLRAIEIGRRLPERDEAMLRADERAALTGMVVALGWEAALEALWGESWLTLRPLPGPTPADPARLAELEAAVERSVAELHDAVRHRWYRPR